MKTQKKNKESPSMRDDTRLALLEQSIGHINQALIRIENNHKDFKQEVNQTMARMEKAQEDIKKEIRESFNKFDNRLWTNFYWTLGTTITLFGVLIGLMAKGFGWFN